MGTFPRPSPGHFHCCILPKYATTSNTRRPWPTPMMAPLMHHLLSDRCNQLSLNSRRAPALCSNPPIFGIAVDDPQQQCLINIHHARPTCLLYNEPQTALCSPRVSRSKS